MRRKQLTRFFAAIGILSGSPAFAQLGMFTNEQRIDITRAWTGERFPDGRPKVPDEVLARLKKTSAEEAWGTLRKHGFSLQFEGGWKTLNVKPGERLVGRAVTGVYMPYRPDLNAVIDDHGRREKRVGPRHNSWLIDTLVKGDVLVVDLFGKIKDGTLIGDNLATSIMTKSGTGLVVNGSVRDPTGIFEIPGFQVYARDFHPSSLADVTLTGLNVPIRIGEATVLPGDVVLSDPDGITFIPAQVAAEVADESELTQLQDEWGHLMLRQQKYTPGEVDSEWSAGMIEEFNRYAASKGAKVRMKSRGTP